MTAELVASPVNAEGKASATAVSNALNSQTEPSHCTTDNIYASPNGRYLIKQYNCEATLSAQLFDLSNPASSPISLNAGCFLNWSSGGDFFLYRQIDKDDIFLIEAANATTPILLDLPFGTYDAAFSADSRQILYAASAGLNLGSQIGLLDLKENSTLFQHDFPDQIVAYPRFSPDGGQLAYILMPDSAIPYTTGELWLAYPQTGEPLTLLDAVDAGHGYAAVWSPDSQSLAYIRRENPDDILADQSPGLLHSNVYQVDVAAGDITQLTHFNETQVYDAIWSPDGKTVAFTANEAVWQLTPGEAPLQISQTNAARHPAWLVEPEINE